MLNLHDVDLEQLDVQRVRRLAPLRISELRRAAFRERAGWEYPIDEEPFINILLPDVQETRTYSKALTLLARADIKEGKISDAQDKICIALGLARHVAEPPFFVNRLVAIANSGLALDTIEELVQHPKSENQYWALNGLPRPFINTIDAIQFESAWIPNTFPEFKNLDTLKTEKEWLDLHQRVYATLTSISNNDKLPAIHSTEYQRMIQRWNLSSRAKLEDVSKFTSDEIEAMPDSEVSLRYWYAKMESVQAQQLAWALLPFHMSNAKMVELHSEISNEIENEPLLAAGCYFWLSFLETAAGLEQRLNMLRTVEAIRDWASKHNGHLPGSLDELDLPAPVDFVTNQPFNYSPSKDRTGATLTASPIGSKRIFQEYELQVE